MSQQSDSEVNLLVLTPEKLERLKINDAPFYNSLTKSKQSLLQAGDWLSEAERNLEAQALRSAISSAYLAIFHSARAVLFRDWVREKSHY